MSSTLEICHRHHALGDEMHIFTLVWHLADKYKQITIYCDYKLMCSSRGKGYEDYIKPFIESLYKSIPNVRLVHGGASAKGISKERLGRLVKPGTNTKLPSLWELDVIPKMERQIKKRYILVPTRVRYPPKGVDWDDFVKLVGQLSLRLEIIFIGERKLDRENKEIFTIYDRLVKHFKENKLEFTDLTAGNNLYKGESKLDHLYRDLNLVRYAEYVLTVGISGFVDICSLLTIVYTIGRFNQPHTKLIWNNFEHNRLQVMKNVDTMRKNLWYTI